MDVPPEGRIASQHRRLEYRRGRPSSRNCRPGTATAAASSVSSTRTSSGAPCNKCRRRAAGRAPRLRRDDASATDYSGASKAPCPRAGPPARACPRIEELPHGPPVQPSASSTSAPWTVVSMPSGPWRSGCAQLHQIAWSGPTLTSWLGLDDRRRAESRATAMSSRWAPPYWSSSTDGARRSPRATTQRPVDRRPGQVRRPPAASAGTSTTTSGSTPRTPDSTRDDATGHAAVPGEHRRASACGRSRRPRPNSAAQDSDDVSDG